MMTDKELRKLAQMIVESQLNNPQWMLEFAKAQAQLRKKHAGPQWINTQAAAESLGISVRTMRSIKHNFTHIKSGDEKQSSVYFDANKLMEEYDRYLASRKKVVSIDVKRAAM